MQIKRVKQRVFFNVIWSIVQKLTSTAINYKRSILKGIQFWTKVLERVTGFHEQIKAQFVVSTVITQRVWLLYTGIKEVLASFCNAPSNYLLNNLLFTSQTC